MIKNLIKKYLPKRLVLFIQSIRNNLNKRKEINLFFKDNTIERNTKNKFCIITDSCEGVGPLSGWFHYMTLVNYAIHNHYIPILDFKNTFMPVFMDYPRNLMINYWDTYFTQPYSSYTLEEAYDSTHILLDYNKLAHEKPNVFTYLMKYTLFKNSNNDFISSISKRDLLLNYKFTKICPINFNLIKKAVNFFCENTTKEQKILGVSFCRGYERLHIIGSKWTPIGTHPVKCVLSQLPTLIDDALAKTASDKFLLVVDDRESLDFIEEKYGSKCFYYKRPLRHLFENGEVINDRDDKITQQKLNVEFSALKTPIEQRNSDYLIEVYLLSLCNSLLSLGGSSDIFAYILKKGNFEYIL